MPAPDPPRAADTALVDVLIKDFIGELLTMTAVVRREDWLSGLETVHRSRTMLHQILVQGNRPLPPHGGKQWSAQLTEQQRPGVR